ncbi:MAG TPA: methyltransferase domain-containing protein [Solirubrobacteraceae bacterium]|nr:methyltransferase domain-containing protein [Solirubrobacteraceae bacterium]
MRRAPSSETSVDGRHQPAAPERFLQRNQPPGVPPLALTGERTLPDVPAENYWFRRHLVVYEWIAARVAGRNVIDMACGEGYGSALIAEHAASVVGVEANPETYEHARLRYRAPNLRFERDLIETFAERAEVIVCLQTIEHVRDPEGVLAHFATLAQEAFVSTPNVLTLAPAGAQHSGNPFHLREYTPEQFSALCAGAFAEVHMLGLYHARKLRAHELALRLGFERAHRALRMTRPFYERFTPAISTRDFALRQARAPRELARSLDLIAHCRR